MKKTVKEDLLEDTEPVLVPVSLPDSASWYESVQPDPAVFHRQQAEIEVDDLLTRADQAFRIRQYLTSNRQRETMGDYGRDLVAQAVTKLEELNASK